MPLSYCGSPKKNVSNSVWGRQKDNHREEACWSGSELGFATWRRERHASGRGDDLTKAQIAIRSWIISSLYNPYLLQPISPSLRERMSDSTAIFIKAANGDLKSGLSFLARTQQGLQHRACGEMAETRLGMETGTGNPAAE